MVYCEGKYHLTFTTMLTLQSHHITDLFVFVDDIVPSVPKPRGGRPTFLTDSELITILLWNLLTMRQHTLKDVHTWARLFLSDEFPKLPKYNGFLEHCHRIAPMLFELLSCLLCTEAPVRILDSTMVPVCKLVRAGEHKVAKGIAKFDTVVKILGYVYPLRALCNAWVVRSRPAARDSRIISRAIRPSKQTLLRTRYTLFCILR
jgi:hypothetical protein